MLSILQYASLLQQSLSVVQPTSDRETMQLPTFEYAGFSLHCLKPFSKAVQTRPSQHESPGKLQPVNSQRHVSWATLIMMKLDKRSTDLTSIVLVPDVSCTLE